MKAVADGDQVPIAIADRITWQGKVFGTETRKCLDYTMVDARSSARTTVGMVRKPPAPGDHFMIGTQLDMHDTTWNSAERRKMNVVKPIGWSVKTQEDQRKWGSASEKWSDAWRLTWTTTDMNERLGQRTLAQRLSPCSSRRGALQHWCR